MIETIGVEVVVDRLDRLENKTLRIDARSVLTPIIKGLQRIAVQISPVDTGSYQASHRVAVSKSKARLYIDPKARNTRSGVLVTSYAKPVEERYHVYHRTASEAKRKIKVVLRDIVKDMVK